LIILCEMPERLTTPAYDSFPVVVEKLILPIRATDSVLNE